MYGIDIFEKQFASLMIFPAFHFRHCIFKTYCAEIYYHGGDDLRNHLEVCLYICSVNSHTHTSLCLCVCVCVRADTLIVFSDS